MQRSKPYDINDLSDKTLLRVFSHLTTPEMLQSVPLVCKRWNAVSRDPSLYRHVVFPRNTPSTAVVVRLMELATLLTSLRLTDRTDTDEILCHVGRGHPGLKTLAICFCKGSSLMTKVSSVHVRNIVNLCDKLESLSLEGTCCGSVELYIEIGLKLPMLRRIDFGSAEEHFSAEAILNVVNNCDGVERLQVRNVEPTPGEVMAEFCNKFHATLDSLDVVPVSWTDEALRALSRCEKLTAIELKNVAAVTHVGISAIADMPNLVDVLIWESYHVTTLCWINFFTSPAIKRIRSLCLQRCVYVTDEVGLTIARELQELKELRLHRTSVSEEGRQEVRRLLPVHCFYNWRDC